jgi:substrate import-associated zinc metallohydrolase lipoprotein
MKKNIINAVLCLLLIGVFGSCREEEILDPNSVFVDPDESANQIEFDLWLWDNYVYPYNVSILYRLKDIETNFSYNVVPADLDKSFALARILKHVWLGALTEVKDDEFTATYIPKTLQLIGSKIYKSDGTVLNGEAEGGVKITFTRVNEIPATASPALLNLLIGGRNEYGVLKTAFHEFTHILTASKNYPESFALISQLDYVGDDWTKGSANDIEALQAGFITKYARKDADEDIAEILSIYVTRGRANWDACMKDAVKTTVTGGVTESDSTGYKIIEEKLSYVKDYLKNSWAIELDTFRTVFERRTATLSEVLETNNNENQ